MGNNNQVKKKTQKVRVYLDVLFFILMIIVLIPQSSGIPIHEWLSFIIIIPFFLHLLINWNWIVTQTKKLFKANNTKRFDYLFNWFFFFLMIVVTVSGILISESALPLFGIELQPDSFWSIIHNASATFFMIALGVHIALHWKWIIGSIKTFKLKSDFHHLTKLQTILSNNLKGLFIIVAISIVFSFIFWIVGFSNWAINIRENSLPHKEGEGGNMMNSWLIYILPLVKVTVLMTIPALLTGGVIRIKNKLKSKSK